MKKARKLDRPRGRPCGPVIDLHESEWRWKDVYEPPIHWEAVPMFLFAVAISYWLVAWEAVYKHEIDPGWLWFLFPSEWHWAALANLL
jgi:hypothetical protein